jgi:non-heme chloroperoxidase
MKPTLPPPPLHSDLHNAMRRRSIAFAFLLAAFVFLSATIRARDTDSWHDPSPHRIRFVNVDNGVKLEVLDWGGTGRPLVLLAGLGNTAHVFDEFAPKLTARYHVYGITRRGFGASNTPATGYLADRLGDDVLAVIDALRIERPSLVGHSIAGEELSSIGSRHPEKVAGLVYLEAGYRYAYDGGAEIRDSEEDMPSFPAATRDPPPPGPADMASFGAFGLYQERVNGVAVPESELRQIYDCEADGSVGRMRTKPWVPLAIMTGGEKYTDIRGPILAIFAVPRRNPGSTNDDAVARAQADAFEKGLPSAKVVRIPHANHYVFISNEADVLGDMDAFLRGIESLQR